MSSSTSSSFREHQPDDATTTSKKRKRFSSDEADANDDVEKALIRLSNVDTIHNVDVEGQIRFKKDMEFFLASFGNEDPKLQKRHLKFFTSQKVANAFSMLYLSNSKELGVWAINRFIEAIKGLFWKFHVYLVPSMLQLCTCLGKYGSRDDQVYYGCRITLRLLFDQVTSDDKLASKLEKLVAWEDILPFVIESGKKALNEISAGLEEASEEDIVKFRGGSEFASFVSGFEKSMTVSVVLDSPIWTKEPSYDQVRCLYEIFCQLRDKMDICLTRVERHLGHDQNGSDQCIHRVIALEYLGVIKALSNLSDIYDGCKAKESIRTMLETRKATFRVLVMEHAFRYRKDVKDGHNYWIFEYKDILTFKCRWELAQMILPEFLGDENVGALEIVVDRTNLFSDSCDQITQAQPEDLQDGLSVQFKNETATGPGVVREWLVLICKKIFDPRNALFIANPNDRRTFSINPASKVQPRHLEYFRFCGQVIALALLHQVQVGIAFDRVLFHQLAGTEILLEDIKDTDPTIYQSCKIILDMDADLVDSDALGLTFSTEFEEFGLRRVKSFHSRGEEIKVDSKNREEYVKEFIINRFRIPTMEQAFELLEGFSDMLKNSDSWPIFFNCITVEDLNRVLRGSDSDLSIEDWQANTDYNGYEGTSCEIIWFWKIIKEMSPEEQHLVLFFWTTIKYLPFEGFSRLPRRLQICRAAGTADHLPTSNTCFYQLCIPPYPTYEIMQLRISVIVQEHFASSFGNI